ncbi:unnamed protein product [Rotaria sp. Silwood2]|nr:unnamed protein product [Rotaria sp. Silwood2]
MNVKMEIFPSSFTGANRRIELAGTDLWITPRIDNVFVYPSNLDLNRLNDALGHILTLWPLVCGRLLLLDEEHYVIEMSDKAVPVTILDNTELRQWPLNSNVVWDTVEGQLQPFLDEVQTTKLWHGSPDEPLFRLKITRLVQSGEWVLGTSWAHVLGDACACLNFLHTFSRFYQQMEIPILLPSFERRLWSKNEVDRSLLPTMRHLCDALSIEQIQEKMRTEQETHVQVNVHFSGEQLARLRTLVDDSTLTIHDIMIAYIILTLNVSCFQKDETIIRHTNIIVNYRGVSNSITVPGLVANCTLRVLSENFDNPYSLLNIAQSIRRSILKSRDRKFLESWLATADELMRDMAHNEHEANTDHFENGIVVNSNFRYDWAGLVDFGYSDKCRFYTDGTSDLFLRVFRLNPIYDGTQWIMRDREGAEVAFKFEKNILKNFLDAWQRDVNENFINVKK